MTSNYLLKRASFCVPFLPRNDPSMDTLKKSLAELEKEAEDARKKADEVNKEERVRDKDKDSV